LSEYDRSYDVRVGAEKPLISGQRAFPVSGLKANPPFAAGKAIYVQRVALMAGQKFQLYQNSLACQQISILNEGGGDLVYGYGGVNLTAPVAAATPQPAGNAFEIAAGAAKLVQTEDAMNIWIGSVAGTTASIEVTGLSYPIIPTQPDVVPSPYVAR